jgi:hypothetical protein
MLAAAEPPVMPAAADIIEAVEAPVQVGPRQMTLGEAFGEYVRQTGDD